MQNILINFRINPRSYPRSRVESTEKLSSLKTLLSISLLITSMGCAVGSENAALLATTSGINLTQIAGNQQTTLPTELFKTPLVVQVSDPVLGTPVPGVEIQFKDSSNASVTILSSSSITNSSGLAQTQIKAPVGYSRSFRITALIKGSTISSNFDLSTLPQDAAYSLKLNTSNQLIETAGVPFSFIVSVVDQSGNIYTDFNQTLSLEWSTQTSHAWGWDFSTANDYRPIPSVSTCQFTAGICTTASIYTLTDATQTSVVGVKDSAGIYTDDRQFITVIPNAPRKIIIANGPGGAKGQDALRSTSDDAIITPSTVALTTDEPLYQFSSGLSDSFGNYIQDLSSTTWSISQESPTSSITPYLSALIGTSLSIAPTKRGSARITASLLSSPDITPASVIVNIDPGVAAKLQITSEHNSSETAGVPFQVSIQAQDAKGNPLGTRYDGTPGMNGTYSVTLSMNQSSFTPNVSQGCNRFHLNNDNLYSGASPICGTRTLSLNFSNGTSTSALTTSLNYAIENYSTPQTIFASLSSGSSSGPLTGTSSPITVRRGPAARIELHSSAVDDGSFLLTRAALESATNTAGSYHIIDSAGSAARTFYAIRTDVAGNYIDNPSTVTWAPTGTLQGAVTPLTGASSTYTPTQSGTGTLTLSYDGVSTVYKSFTGTKPLDHFLISLSDGTNTNTSLDVTKLLSLKIEAVDDFNNPVSMNGNYNLTLTATGATTSPKGTAPILPSSGVYTFTNGQVIIPSLRLPNASSSVQLGVSYFNGSQTLYSKPASVSGAASSTTLLTPTLAASSIAILQIRSSANNQGSNYTATPLTLPSGSSPATLMFSTDSTPTIYLNTYDSEGNFVNSTTPADWSWTSPSIATLSTSSSSSSTTFQPTQTGTGTLTASHTTSSSQVLTATTGTVTVTSGTADHLELITQNARNEVAGTPFSLAIRVFDSRNNLITTFSGQKALTFAILNGSAMTSYGLNYLSPSNGNFTFSNGQLSSPTASFTLYNALTTPSIQVTVQDSFGTNLTATTGAITISNTSMDHIDVKAPTSGSSFLAGDTFVYTLKGIDFWGNLVTSGSDANRSVSFAFLSTLTNPDLISTSLSSPTPSSFSGAQDHSVSGGLTAGLATLQLTATQAGTLSGSAVPTVAFSAGSPRADTVDTITVLPNSTIASIAWSTAPPSTYTASNTVPMASFTAKLLDTFGNIITTNNSSQVNLSRASGTGVLSGTLNKPCVSGIATFNDIVYPRAELISLTATAIGGSFPAGMTSQTSLAQSVTVSPGSAVRAIAILPGQTYLPGVSSINTAVSGAIPNQTAGTPYQVNIRVVDSGFNTITSVNDSVSYTISDAQVTPQSSTLAAGSKTFSLTSLTAPSTQTLTPSVSGLTNTPSNSFTVKPAPPSKVVLTSTPQTLIAGACSSAVSIQIQDTYGNLSNVISNTTLTSTGNSAGSTFYSDSGCLTLASGNAIIVDQGANSGSFYFKTPKAGPLTITVSGTSLASASQVETIQPGSPSKLTYLQSPVNTPADAPLNPISVVAVQDTFGNTVTSFGSVITMALGNNPNSATLSGSTTGIASSGLVSFSNLSIHAPGIGYTLVVSSGALSSVSNPFNIIPTPVHLLTAGNDWTCILVEGSALCWGNNASGQLGDNSTSTSKVPLTVRGIYSGLTDISAALSGNHSCAIENGSAQCWGDNSNGQLGLNNASGPSLVPSPVFGLTSGISAIAAGEKHSCAIRNGSAQCWGNNDTGQLGNGSNTATLAPSPVTGLTAGVQMMATGSFHTCSVVNGGVQCWGKNDSGQLGNGSNIQSNLPVAATGLGSTVSGISAGNNHTCAIVNQGAQCWGSNSHGQLGVNSADTESLIPIPVFGLTTAVSAISAGSEHTCAIVNQGAQCWGRNNQGQLGINSVASQSIIPVPVDGLTSGVTAIAAGHAHTCAIANGITHCWGIAAGLGNNSTSNSLFPTRASLGVTSLAVGSSSTCAIINGSAQCWGGNDFGQLGNGSNTQSLIAVQVSGLTLGSGVTRIAAGRNHACALINQAVKCWGSNSNGQLGDNFSTQTNTPVGVIGLTSNVSDITSGLDHNCAIHKGAAHCWGANSVGQLGDGLSSDSVIPVQVSGLALGVTSISAGPTHTCAVVTGQAQCWGANNYGQLGNGSTIQSLIPVQVSGLTSGVTAIATGGRHSCAISQGSVKCWGENVQGQLGDGSSIQSNVPVSASGLTSGVTSISAGTNSSCAVVNSGTLCWGDNQVGQLGNNSILSSLTPVPVYGLNHGFKRVSSSRETGTLLRTCAIVNGGVQCWGDNSTGAFGDSSTTDSLIPLSPLLLF